MNFSRLCPLCTQFSSMNTGLSIWKYSKRYILSPFVYGIRLFTVSDGFFGTILDCLFGVFRQLSVLFKSRSRPSFSLLLEKRCRELFLGGKRKPFFLSSELVWYLPILPVLGYCKFAVHLVFPFWLCTLHLFQNVHLLC